MGCGASSSAGKYQVATEDKIERRPSRNTSIGNSSVSANASDKLGPASTKPNAGHHWAEASPGKERRTAERPWNANDGGTSTTTL